jgi:hypothetical protein
VTHVFEIVAGPDAGRLMGLAPGRHLIGRAAGCAVAIDDPAVESHHGVVTAHPDGGLHLAQLAGRCPVLVDGRPAGDGIRLGPGAAVEIGDSLIVRRDARASLDAAPPDAAEASRRRDLARRGGGTVVLGAGTVRLAIDLAEHAGRADEHGLPFDLQAAIERIEVRHRHPVLADLARTERAVIGLTAAGGPATVARAGLLGSIVAQLAADPMSCRWPVVCALGGRSLGRVDLATERVVLITDRAAPLVDGERVDRLIAHGVAVTVLLLVDPASPTLRRCTSLLHLGARWRARWIADTAVTADPFTADPFTAVRLHVRGVRPDHLTTRAVA